MECPAGLSLIITTVPSGALAIRALMVCRRCHSVNSLSTPETTMAASVIAAACHEITLAVAVTTIHMPVCEPLTCAMTRHRTRRAERLPLPAVLAYAELSAKMTAWTREAGLGGVSDVAQGLRFVSGISSPRRAVA
jgi:hypothetical protein